MKRSISRPGVGLPSPSAPSSYRRDHFMLHLSGRVYAPARLHSYLLQAPPIALELAFLGMCHFCFPAAADRSGPNCWDAIHAVCGQCTRETQRSLFDMETPPLAGTLYPSTHSILPIDDHSISPSLVPCATRSLSGNPPTIHECYIQQAPHTRHPVKSTGTSIVSSHIDIDAIETRPDPASSLDIAIETRQDRTGTPIPTKSKPRPDHFRNRNQIHAYPVCFYSPHCFFVPHCNRRFFSYNEREYFYLQTATYRYPL